jgi:hypothetical protein
MGRNIQNFWEFYIKNIKPLNFSVFPGGGATGYYLGYI